MIFVDYKVNAGWNQRSADLGIRPEAREAPVVLSGNAFEDLRSRYRELGGAIAWAVALLDEEERSVLTRFAR